MVNNDKVEKNLSEHKIVIDEYIEVNIKIPKILDGIEFNSLLEKSRKLLKLSEVQVPQLSKHININVDNKRLLEEYSSSGFGNRQHLVSKYGFKNYQALQSKIYSIREKLQIKNGRKKYSDDFIDRCVEQITMGKYVPELSKEFNINKKTLYKIISKRTGKTIKELRKKKNNYPKKRFIWDDIKTTTLKELYSKGLSNEIIAKRFNITSKQIEDKIYLMKKKDKIPGR